MSAPTKLKAGRLKDRIKKWITRKQTQSQNQSSASLPLSTISPASPGPAPILGQHSSTHGSSNTHLPSGGSPATSPQTQITSSPGPSSSAGPSTNVAPATNISPANVTTPAANQTPTSNANAPSACWTGLERLAGVLTSVSSTFGPLGTIVKELVDCVSIYEMAARDKEEYKALQNELEELFTELQGYFANADGTSSTEGASVDPTAESLCKCIHDELEGVKAKQVNSGLKQHLRGGSVQDEVLACYRRVHGHLIRLSIYVSSSTKKSLEKQTKILQKQAENAHSDRVSARLDRLRPSLSACYNSAQAAELKRGGCTTGTRMDALARMHSHASNSKSGAVFWLNGMAGTGKTTIAYTFCAELSSKRHLAASFFCSRLLPECRDVNMIIPSIAYQLASYSQSFRATLFKALEADPDIPTRSLHSQFEDLIAEPLLTIQRNNALPPNLIVVIDALDECEKKDSTRMILEIILIKSSNLPIKFFVSSRPEPEIRDEMARQLGDDHSSRLVLHELEEIIVQADIEKYLRVALARLDLSNEVFAELARDAGVLFIYAATVVRYISYSNFNQNPRGRLQTVLNASSPGTNQKNKAIDSLYNAIITEALDDEELDDVERNDIVQVLHAIICAQEPLAISTLSGLLRFGSTDRVRAAIRPLWSVLHITGTSEIVTTLHASFPDFILNETRSGRYHCNSKAHNRGFSQLCFDIIEAAPPFNICELKSSFIRDKKVTDLDARVRKAILPELFYACRYWGAHIDLAGDSTELGEMVSSFLSTRFLLWLEVMNLKKSIQVAVDVMKRVDDWSMRQAHSKELIQLVDDARCFTTAFASTPVSQSTPHLYFSMLPFWPQSRPVSQAYAKAFSGLPRVEGTAMHRRQLALLATWSFGNILDLDSRLFNSVRSATFSPDGRRVAFATHNRILVIDSLTGRQLSRPLRGHANPLLSVEYSPDGTQFISSSAFAIQVQDAKSGSVAVSITLMGTAATSVRLSPDGTRIVSAYESRSIYTWDAQSGEQVLGPLEGHTDRINIVIYSPDSGSIISGSRDKTLRIWDARNGAIITIIGPLLGHNRSILSAGYSPDGTRVVFGSADSTIGVYCTLDRRMLLDAITGHTEAVTSVTYSPDGKHIISGSEDKTIRVWDAQTGDLILGPLEGHTSGVLSVAYSPDGSRIVSSSYDKTIRMWDGRIKGLILNPLECHTGVVTSTGYSPDGTRICSGSEDKTIYVWDAECGKLVLEPLRGHTDWVESVCYSPNGLYIASGSRDKTILIWDAQSGALILGPLRGHTKPITSLCYSPDGTYVASGAKDATIRVWDTQSGSMTLGPLEPEGSTKLSWVVSVKFSPSGTRIIGASGSDHKDMGIQIWDVSSGNTVLVVRYGKKITALEYSPDGASYIFGSTDSTIRICDAQNGEIMRQIGARAPGARDLTFHTITSVGFSPAGDYILSSSSNNIIQLWDARSGGLSLGPLAGHIDQINSVCYSSDGGFVTSGSSDATIRVWNVRLLSESHPTYASPHSNWELNPDGWVADSKNRSQILTWVPYDLRRSIIRSGRNTMVISRNGSVSLNFDDAFMGGEWARCYVPSA